MLSLLHPYTFTFSSETTYLCIHTCIQRFACAKRMTKVVYYLPLLFFFFKCLQQSSVVLTFFRSQLTAAI